MSSPRAKGAGALSVLVAAAVAATVAVTGHGGDRHATGHSGADANNAAYSGIPTGQTLDAGESALSADGDYQLLMQPDGDLVENTLYDVSPRYDEVHDPYGNAYLGGGNTQGGILTGRHVERIWHTGTAGHPGARAVMQGDGNLVVAGPDGAALWTSGTAGHPGAVLEVQSDANVVVYDASGRSLWSDDRVSTTESGGSEPSNLRNCPGTMGGDFCAVADYLPNGTGVTMECWTDTPGGGSAGATTDRWFYVHVQGPAGQGAYGFLNADLVRNQIPTPKCVEMPGIGTPQPSGPSVAPATPVPTAPPATPAPAPAAPPATTAPAPAPAPSSALPSSAPPAETPSNPPVDPPAPAGVRERSGSHGSPTFTNPANASGPGTRVPAMSTVTVLCRVYAPAIASANPDGWWYRIGSPPWNGAYYAVANTFWNGDVPGQLPYTHNTDWSVPVC